MILFLHKTIDTTDENGENYRRSSGSRHLLLTDQERLTPEKRARLRRVLRKNRMLGEAYDLKEFLRQVYNTDYSPPACRQTGRNMRRRSSCMRNWCEFALESGLPVIEGVAGSIIRWFGKVPKSEG